MNTVAGVFASKVDAERAATKLIATGLAKEKIVLLVPNGTGKSGQTRHIPTSTTEQPGMGAAVGGAVGGAFGIAGGLEAGAVASAAIPGVGPVIAMGMLGAAILGAAGAGIGAAVGDALEEATDEGLPVDEWFVYEDALRKGRSVVLAFPDKDATASVRKTMEVEGAENIDAARQQWWIGLRSAEREHYSKAGKNFDRDEKFYQLGFEAALQTRRQCQDDNQALSEMKAKLEQLQKQYPESIVEEPFSVGYERGRQYYRNLCNQPAGKSSGSKVA